MAGADVNDVGFLIWGFIFSTIGMGFAIYGKRQRKPIPLACGIALAMMPYFVDTSLEMGLLGVVLMVIPYFVRL